MNSKTLNIWLLAALASTILSISTGCSDSRPTIYVTGTDYLILKKGQTFVAPRDMVLATESTIQEKNAMLVELVKVGREMQAELDYYRSVMSGREQ